MKKKFTELDITVANIINREWKRIRTAENKKGLLVDAVDVALDELLEIFKNELGAAAAQVEKDRLDNPTEMAVSLDKRLSEKEVLGEPYVFLNKTLLMLFLKSTNWKAAYKESRNKIADVIRKKNPKGHAHSKAMAIYASDALETSTPWERWELYCGNWQQCTETPMWDTSFRYRHTPSGYVSSPFHDVADEPHVEDKATLENPNILWKISVENADEHNSYYVMSPKNLEELEAMVFAIRSWYTYNNMKDKVTEELNLRISRDDGMGGTYKCRINKHERLSIELPDGVIYNTWV